MPININTSNYINSQTANQNTSVGVPVGVNDSGSEGVVVSVKGLDLQAGQTLSGQIVEIDGKDIKLLLSNNQTINARLEGNINALLGQTLSFEVKNTENGQTALRPLYTNLDNSQTVTNALRTAGLPVTDNYAKMVSSMMDEGLPINKGAIYDMSKQINSFPNASPDTVVKLNKLGLQVNELTINQYENYKGLEHQIKNNVDTLSKGLSDLIKDSLADTVKGFNIDDIAAKNSTNEGALLQESVKATGTKNLLSAFLSAITGNDTNVADNQPLNSQNALSENASGELIESEETLENAVSTDKLADTSKATIDASVFDTSKLVLNMVNPEDSEQIQVSKEIKTFIEGFKAEAEQSLGIVSDDLSVDEANTPIKTGRANILNELAKEAAADVSKNNETPVFKADSNISVSDYTGKNVLSFAKDLLDEISKNPQKFPEEIKEKLTKLVSSKEFLSLVKDNISKQMLLKPEEVVNSKNVDDLYEKITRQANQALEILTQTGRENPEMMQAAKNINDNVNFMNELNQVVTYVQLPLLMNNKSAHGDLYVYTNKKSLKNNDGNISALLHLDMENLGPMDIYVQLTNSTKLNTHFYLKDDATIDFIESHIDLLNRRLTEKGYDMNMNISVKDSAKGPTNMADEFLKDDPSQEGASASKFSFDVRA